MTHDLLVTEEDLDVAARTVIGEARGEAREGRVAVAWVIRNRVTIANAYAEKHGIRHHYGPPHPTGICRQPFAFSCWNPRDPNLSVIEKTSRDAPVYGEALAVVTAVFNDEIPDPTHGATLYEAVKGVPRAWNAAFIAETVRIGAHTFYRETF